MTDTETFKVRADAIADTLRTFLIAIHTGGLGVVFAVAASLADKCVEPRWAVASALAFTSGLVLVGFSLLLAKHKAVKRRKAAEKGLSLPSYEFFLWRNFTWDAATLAVFVLGVLLGLCELSGLSIGCPP